MIKISKKRYDERTKDAIYMVGIECDYNAGESKVASFRNKEPLGPDELTDEDCLCLLQMSQMMYDELMKLCLRRNLLPEEVAEMVEQRTGQQ